MIKAYKKNIPAYEFHCFQKFSDIVQHAVFSRLGGVSEGVYQSLNLSYDVQDKEENVTKNRELVAKACGIESTSLISAHQTHSKNVILIDREMLKNSKIKQEFEDTDGFITDLPEVGLLIKVADCQAILMLDPVQKVIAAIHAGWRGLVQDISGATIELMMKNFSVEPENILVGLSPSLGPCCSFFTDPHKELPPSFEKYIHSNRSVDLWQYSIDQLKSHGIAPENIESARICSSCGAGGKFYSFRRDKGKTGRFGAMIWLK